MTSIPFNKPFIVGNELDYIARAVTDFQWLSGDGRYTQQCQKWVERELGCRKALLTHSCTAALEIAALLADIGPGDEIIMPSFTFVSTANAFVLRGGVPVFVDIRPDTLNIDEQLIERAVTRKTRAVVPVHYAGISCAMDAVTDIARRHNLIVIEDAAQALLSQYRDRFLGTIGSLGALSFHETKNIISGEGGMLLINDERFGERAEILWQKGTDRKKFFRGEVDKYSWVDVGSSFLPSEMIAAFLYAQMEHAKEIIRKRFHIFQTYYQALEGLAAQGRISLPFMDDECRGNGHIFYVITGSLSERTGLMQHLQGKGIGAVFHYVPLHDSPAGRRFGRACGTLQVTQDMSERLLRLPMFYEMSDREIAQVAAEIYAFYGAAEEEGLKD